jgi:hypothetical protein
MEESCAISPPGPLSDGDELSTIKGFIPPAAG